MRPSVLWAVLACIPRPAAAQKPTDLNVGLAAVSLLSASGQTQISLSTAGQSLFPITANPIYVSGTFYQSPNWGIEPGGSVNFVASNGSTLALIQLDLALPYYAEGAFGHKGLYFAPRGGVTIVHGSSSGGSSNTNEQVFLGLGVGSRIPLSERVGLRAEVNATDALANSTFSQFVTVSAVIGLSVQFGGTKQ